jgi:hypothetical protein
MTVLFNSIMPGSLFLLLGKINDRVDKGKWVVNQ